MTGRMAEREGLTFAVLTACARFAMLGLWAAPCSDLGSLGISSSLPPLAGANGGEGGILQFRRPKLDLNRCNPLLFG